MKGKFYSAYVFSILMWIALKRQLQTRSITELTLGYIDGLDYNRVIEYQCEGRVFVFTELSLARKLMNGLTFLGCSNRMPKWDDDD